MKYISKFMNELGKTHKVTDNHILYKGYKILVKSDGVKIFEGDKLIKTYKTTVGFLNNFFKKY